MSQKRIYIREKRSSKKYENEISETWEFGKDYMKYIWEWSKGNPLMAGLLFLSGYMIGIILFH